jgi:hypothetical protein
VEADGVIRACVDRRQGDRRRGRPRRAEDVATADVRIRLTPAERTDLEEVARANGHADLASFIRDAVNTAVAEYRERGVFVDRKPPTSLTL